ncbi:MAG: hypothetical protein JSV50_01395, partial [Desulfobacteraceae bacterium]
DEKERATMPIIRFEDERDQVQYGLDEEVLQNGVTSGLAELLGGNFFEGLRPTGERARVIHLLAPIVTNNVIDWTCLLARCVVLDMAYAETPTRRTTSAIAIPYVSTNRIATYLEPEIFPYASWLNSLL